MILLMDWKVINNYRQWVIIFLKVFFFFLNFIHHKSIIVLKNLNWSSGVFSTICVWWVNSTYSKVMIAVVPRASGRFIHLHLSQYHTMGNSAFRWVWLHYIKSGNTLPTDKHHIILPWKWLCGNIRCVHTAIRGV